MSDEQVQVGSDGHTHETECLDCGTALVGPHCHQCGQHAHVHRTLGAFFHDLLHGVFHFEGRIWRTLPMLAWHPGRLTRDYIAGQRMRYVSPVALFLFSIFLLFAVMKSLGPSLAPDSEVEVNGHRISGVEANEAELTRLRAERAKLAAAHQPTTAIDDRIKGRQEGLAVAREMRDAVKDLGQIKPEQNVSDIPALDHALKEVGRNPQLAAYKLQSYAYKYAWALIPFSVPFVWLLFAFNRRYGLYDHTVFVTYSLSFMALLAVTLALLGALHMPFTGPALMLLPVLHMYRQVKHAYALGTWSALWRTGALVVIAMVALTAFAVFLIAEAGA